MALAVAEVERVKRNAPDYQRLEKMVRESLVGKGWMASEDDAIPYRRLGVAINYSHAAVYNVLVKYSRPQREMLIALADFFDAPREAWQEAGGYDVERLPTDRGWTTVERELARWYDSLTDDQKGAALREARELRSRLGDHNDQ